VAFVSGLLRAGHVGAECRWGQAGSTRGEAKSRARGMIAATMASRPKGARSDLLARVRRFCATLDDVEESSRLGGQPHFYVRGKIFAGCGEEDGGWCVGMKVGLELQSLLVTRTGFRVAKYVGKHGWITVDEAALADDGELRRLLRISYDLISACAPKGKVGKGTSGKVAPRAKRSRRR